MAHKARRGKATMLQKALDPNMKHKDTRDNDWDTCSESSFEGSLSSLRMADTGTPRSGTASPRENSEGARHLQSRLELMGIAPTVEEPSSSVSMTFGSSYSLCSVPFSKTPFPPTMQMEGIDPTTFLLRAPPPYAMVECLIRRDNTDKRHPKFQLFLEHNRHFLLAARKRKLTATSNYVISTDRMDLGRHSASFVGKLRANFIGTEFLIYDNGERQATAQAQQRRTLGCVLYERNVLGAGGPRKMRVAIPRPSEDGEAMDWGHDGEDRGKNSFIENFLAGDRIGTIPMRSAEPEWVPEKNTFVLDFNGRVKRSSVKNFQLKEDGKPPILMQFGKVSKDEFIVDFQHPFNALQAFAIALSSFDNKLACE
eukprot:GGOE01020242.1.p1 GENE.GGOE01020242.1~~GGOE01020242.1.p1  ORF type:complete len:422 (+),score=125.10 GGOE01020242.1:165-1268(+)